MTITLPLWPLIAVYLIIALCFLIISEMGASGCHGWVTPLVQALIWPLMILIVVWLIVDVIRTVVLQAMEDWRRQRKTKEDKTP